MARDPIRNFTILITFRPKDHLFTNVRFILREIMLQTPGWTDNKMLEKQVDE